MDKFIPYRKLSKKERQKLNKAKRGSWGEFSPVTRKLPNAKAYNRKRAQAWKKDLPDLRSFFAGIKRQRMLIHNQDFAVGVSY